MTKEQKEQELKAELFERYITFLKDVDLNNSENSLMQQHIAMSKSTDFLFQLWQEGYAEGFNDAKNI